VKTFAVNREGFFTAAQADCTILHSAKRP